MRKFLCGLAVLPFLSAAALAQPANSGGANQPMQLSEGQMDSVTAGFSFFEKDVSNTSFTVVSLWNDPNTVCAGNYYLQITSQAFTIASAFGPNPHS